MELSDARDRVEELQSMNYEMLDYLRTQLAWLLDYLQDERILQQRQNRPIRRRGVQSL